MPNTNSGKLQKLCIQASKILGTRNLPSLVSNFSLLPHAVFSRAAIWICFIVAAFLHKSNSFATVRTRKWPIIVLYLDFVFCFIKILLKLQILLFKNFSAGSTAEVYCRVSQDQHPEKSTCLL